MITVYSVAARRSMVTATTELTQSDMEQRCYRFKRKVFILTVIVSGFMCYTLYSISCCEMISRTDALTGRRYIQIYERGDEDNLYRATVVRSRPGFHFFGKNLLEDSPAFRDKYRDRYVRANDEGNNFDIEERDDDLDEDEDSEEDRTEWNQPYAGHTSGNTYHKSLNASRKLPQAIIIGVKKGGTRALLEFIRLHPDVRAVGPETHFFDRHYDRGLLWYRNQMPTTLDGQITMEKTPSYFVTREVPRRVFNMSKDVRLVVVVRDPVTRAISDYTQTVSKKHGMKSFEELAFLNNTTGLVDTTWGAIRIGVYAKHLERWLQYFPINQILFVSGELLIKDPAGELAKVQDFLSLKRIVSEKHFYFNETKGFPCLKKAEGGNSPHCLGKTKGRQHPKVDPYAIHRLREFYRPFNMKFYQMTNQNFGWA